MDVRRRSRLRTTVCVGLPALALALCAVLGVGTGVAHAASGYHGHAAVTPARHQSPNAFFRVHDPIGYDVTAAEQSVETSRTAEHTTPLLPLRQGSGPNGAWHNRGPPAGEHT